MLLILLAPCFILAAVVILGKHLSSLTYLKTTSGTLVGFERNDKTQEFHPIISFYFNKDKYFFKNTNSTPYPRHTLGSRHVVYFESPAKKVEVMYVPLKATLANYGKNENLPWILMGLGIFCIGFFAQITGFYFLLVIAIVGLRYFYLWAKANLFFANSFDNSNEQIPPRFPLSETFSEDKFKEMKVLDLKSLQLCREQWLSKQQSNGLAFGTFAVLCLAASLLTAAPPETPESIAKAPVIEKALSIEEVLDAGSVSAAEDVRSANDPNRKIYCTWIDINSCIFGYMALQGEEGERFVSRSLNLLVLNIGLLFLAFSIVCFFSRSIFSQHDLVATPKKEDPLPLAIAVPQDPTFTIDKKDEIKIEKK